MFTGLIEEIGTIVDVRDLEQGSRIRIRAPESVSDLAVGDSIAVDGVCLTALDLENDGFAADVSPETLARTNLGQYEAGAAVNLERPLAAGQRLGGHFVQGHVDAAASVVDVVDEGEFVRMRFSLPPQLRPYLVEKGSVAVNGVSLTVAGLEPDSFDVALIPHTLECTNLGRAGRTARVNLEVDILGKYVAQLLAQRADVEVASVEGSGDPG